VGGSYILTTILIKHMFTGDNVMYER